MTSMPVSPVSPLSPLSPLTRLTRMLILAGAAVTIGLMAYAGRPWKEGLQVSLLFLVFAAVATAPGWILWWMARANDSHRAARIVAAVGAALIIVSANVLYILVLFVDEPDAQAGLVFVFLPMLQFVAVALTQLGVVIARRASPASNG